MAEESGTYHEIATYLVRFMAALNNNICIIMSEEEISKPPIIESMNPTMKDFDSSVPVLAPASVSSTDSSCECCSSRHTVEPDVVAEKDQPPKEIETRRSKVSFGEVIFRNYPIILGDHPDCIGPPIALDWECVNEEHYDLEEYEAGREPRKHDEGLVLDWLLRKRMLRCYAGTSEDAMNESSLECSRIRRQREQTRKSVQHRSHMRHLLSRFSGGLLGDKAIKHKDRSVHLARFKNKTTPGDSKPTVEAGC
ncbi:expressed unknown protein [Seminavis robusta]|uniref:Uncharacterized protein n=1 Tax=Seminavis robusta TaxID=568900 RepID=A0A9N8D4Y8_9STRA|nr:expressed unknown protein [Seminavis robusta]|eukprot:Sro2_g001400.1 n/a (252) ;mRNA; r:141541-142393